MVLIIFKIPPRVPLLINVGKPYLSCCGSDFRLCVWLFWTILGGLFGLFWGLGVVFRVDMPVVLWVLRQHGRGGMDWKVYEHAK